MSALCQKRTWDSRLGTEEGRGAVPKNVLDSNHLFFVLMQIANHFTEYGFLNGSGGLGA